MALQEWSKVPKLFSSYIPSHASPRGVKRGGFKGSYPLAAIKQIGATDNKQHSVISHNPFPSLSLIPCCFLQERYRGRGAGGGHGGNEKKQRTHLIHKYSGKINKASRWRGGGGGITGSTPQPDPLKPSVGISK